MKSRLPLLISLFSICSFAHASDEPVFRDGDRFQYELFWSLIKVGHAELKYLEEPMIDGEPDLIHIVFTAKTSGIADQIFKVRDKIEVWIDPVTNRPILYLKEQREGKTHRDVRVDFDWEEMTATYSNKGTAKAPVPISENTLDPLSLINALAAAPFTRGERRTEQVTDGKKVVQIEANVIKEESCNTPAGRFSANRIDVATKELRGVFEKSPDASITLWLSKDVPAIPLKMKSKVVVGSFHGRLVAAVVDGETLGKLKEF